MNQNYKIGLLLIGIGIFILLNQLNILTGRYFLHFLGVGFLFAYWAVGGRKKYGNVGFLIPGLVLLAIAFFSTGKPAQYPSLFFLLLSLAFWGVLAVHTFWFFKEDWGTRFWPVFPGGGLLLFTAFLQGVTVWNWSIFNFWNYLVPIVLIGIGLSFLLKRGPKGKE